MSIHMYIHKICQIKCPILHAIIMVTVMTQNKALPLVMYSINL